MKVFFVVSYFHDREMMNFGPYPLIYNIVKNLSERVDVTVLSYGWPKYTKESYIDGINVIRTPIIPSFHSSLRTSYLSMGFFGLSRVVNEKPDVINSQDIGGAFLFQLLNLGRRDTPKVVSLKGSYDGWSECLPASILNYGTKVKLRFLKYYEHTCVLNSDRIVVPSDFLKREVMRFYDIDDEKVIRIHNGVDVSMFFPKPVDKAHMVLFFTGGDSYRKGADIVINSFVRLKKKYAGIKLIISGTNIERFRPIFDKNEIVLGKDIIFKGNIPYREMPYYFNLCDIFLMPSYHETFCTAVAEAMACGKPVVVSDNTAMSEVVADCGLLVSPGDLDSFVEAVSRLLDDEKLRRRMGKKARRRVESLFSIDRVIEDYLKFFRSFV